jgi:membrane-associated protein
MSRLLDFLLHSDRYLLEIVTAYGSWVYGVLFVIVFAETGLVATPFLPGDSLLFAVGALCAAGVLNTPLAAGLLVTAAFLGDTVNYSIGRRLGPKVFSATDRNRLSHRLLNQEHLDRAHEFFLRYGGKAVVLCRFVPIVRTFLPFVAGAARMPAHTFMFYNLTGGIGWVVLCMGAGLLFGNVPIVKENFSLVTIGIVVVSVLPMVVEYLRHRARS